MNSEECINNEFRSQIFSYIQNHQSKIGTLSRKLDIFFLSAIFCVFENNDTNSSADLDYIINKYYLLGYKAQKAVFHGRQIYVAIAYARVDQLKQQVTVEAELEFNKSLCDLEQAAKSVLKLEVIYL